jgi:uncharacterized protein YndB with AHSA1/START domain
MTDITTTHSVTIDAAMEDVWRALTTPKAIEEWFFGVETESDWQVGSSLVHRGEWQGKPYEDKGTITRIEPPTTLVHTHWSPAGGLPDEPGNYQEVRWTLGKTGDGATVLTLNESNLPSEEAKAVSDQAWDAALQKLKELLEA